MKRFTCLIYFYDHWATSGEWDDEMDALQVLTNVPADMKAMVIDTLQGRILRPGRPLR
jgi:hypothetical protein